MYVYLLFFTLDLNKTVTTQNNSMRTKTKKNPVIWIQLHDFQNFQSQASIHQELWFYKGTLRESRCNLKYNGCSTHCNSSGIRNNKPQSAGDSFAILICLRLSIDGIKELQEEHFHIQSSFVPPPQQCFQGKQLRLGN